MTSGHVCLLRYFFLLPGPSDLVLFSVVVMTHPMILDSITCPVQFTVQYMMTTAEQQTSADVDKTTQQIKCLIKQHFIGPHRCEKKSNHKQNASVVDTRLSRGLRHGQMSNPSTSVLVSAPLFCPILKEAPSAGDREKTEEKER